MIQKHSKSANQKRLARQAQTPQEQNNIKTGKWKTEWQTIFSPSAQNSAAL